MCKRSEKKDLPKIVTLVDPHALALRENFVSVFGAETPVETCEQEAREVDWLDLLGG
ncbi:MAG: hypothetical protein JSW59_17760 [Phycisphaerales bacterium]|nr:MAG: hypothetical protein JSW59_17760 [Phycisphaerales bacterium]